MWLRPYPGSMLVFSDFGSMVSRVHEGALVFTFLQYLLVSLRMDEAFKQALFGLILIVLLIAYSRESRQ